MAFEKFDKTGRSYTPKVSIWSRGQIGFSQGAVERFNIRDYKYAVLYYDKEERKIGIKFTNDASESGIAKIVHGKTGAFFSASSFLGYYDIDHSKTRRYDINYDSKNKLYVFELGIEADS